MANYTETLTELYKTLAQSLGERLKDDECPPAIYKEAREFLKDNSINKDNLSTPTFDDLSGRVPLENFEDDIGATAH